MARTIVLLRGINVSGKNKVPMAELRTALSGAGFANVATYIQSGNIAIDADPADDTLERVETLLGAHFDVHVPAISIDQSQLGMLEAQAPFPSDADPATSLIYFPRGEVDVAGVESLDPDAYPGDMITATPAAVYVAYGQGQSKSKLTVDRLEKAASTTLTGRNLRTVAKLKAL